MRYEQIEKLEGEKFRRLTGVKQSTFNRMMEILDEEDRRKKAKMVLFGKKEKTYTKNTINNRKRK